MTRIVITGVGGFLGARIARLACARGVTIVGVDRSGTRPARLLEAACDPVDYRPVDLRRAGELARLVSDVRPDTIVHCAAVGVSRSSPQSLRDATDFFVMTAVEVATAAAACAAGVAWIGSCFEYAPSPELIDEGHELAPESDYGFAKLLGWKTFLRVAGPRHRYVTLRPFHLYGPGEEAVRLAPTALLAPTGRAENRFGDPDVIRDFVFVDDAADAILHASRALARGKIETGREFNVATGIGTTIRDFCAEAARQAGVPDFEPAFASAPPLPGYDPARLVGSPVRAATELAWTAETRIGEGLRKTLVQLRAIARPAG
jgi:nucleoside-diphosphate-sugar epimerase